MASPLTLPDALCSALRFKLLLARPAPFISTTDWPASRFVLQAQAESLPCPRVVIVAGEPVFQRMMIGTARIPFQAILATSLDGTTPADHRTAAGALDEFLRGLGATPGAIASVYLHAVDVLFPLMRIDGEAREQVTVCRASAMCTLLV